MIVIMIEKVTILIVLLLLVVAMMKSYVIKTSETKSKQYYKLFMHKIK